MAAWVVGGALPHGGKRRSAQGLMLIGGRLSWDRSCWAHGKSRSKHAARWCPCRSCWGAACRTRHAHRWQLAQGVWTFQARASPLCLERNWRTLGTRLPPPADPSPQLAQLRMLSGITDLDVNSKAGKCLKAALGAVILPYR